MSRRSQQSEILNTVDISSPIATSTPNSKVKRKHLTMVKANERITLLNINCRSIKNKIPDLHQVIQQVKPDIISCTETWLKPEVHISEMFSNTLNYQVFRDDITTNQGGVVLIAISRDFICQEQPELKTNCNIQWVKMTIKGVKDIYVGSFYKPTENESLKSNCKFKVMYGEFMERIQNFNLQQMVTTPTRQENILDIFLTNTPSLVQNTKTLPSLSTSDHDVVFHELHIKIGRPFKPQKTN